MTDQPEALRLAVALTRALKQTDAEDQVIHVARWFVEDSVTELRRLHGEVERLREVTGQALEAMEKATRYMSNSDYIKLNQTIDATRAALKETE